MSGLVLKLSPRERLLINGAVIENGDRRAQIAILTPDVNILRLKDSIHPDDATTPIKRLCYTLQLVLSGDKCASQVEASVVQQFEVLAQVFRGTKSESVLREAKQSFAELKFYQSMRKLKSLVDLEELMLS